MSDKNLLKSINDIDDDLIFEAENWKRPKVHKLRLAVIAAAAAVLCAATAVTAVAIQNNSEYYEKTVQAVDHPFYLELEEKTDTTTVEYLVECGDYKFYLDVKSRGMIIPEEYRTVDEHGRPWHNERMRGMLPSELFAQFGVSPLLNDNFSEIIEFKPNYMYVLRPNGEKELFDVDYGDPVLTIDDCRVIFSYRLYNKNTQRNITLQATYVTDDDYSCLHGIGVDDDTDYEIIELNDGSMCYLDMGGAVFSYDGVQYNLNMYDTKENNDELSLELTKQTLEALGVL